MRKSRRTFLLVALATVASCAAILTFAIPKTPGSVRSTCSRPTPSGSPSPVLSTKQRWVEDAAERFRAADIRTASGAPVEIEVKPVLSGDSMLQIVDGTLKPTVWSPASRPGSTSWMNAGAAITRRRSTARPASPRS